ncbi:MAG: hypothetical protein ACRC67_31110 [Inquilinus sp.]|uniref:hypothetical protein n=1 Tax=Inquilinus sp. TaxID=1932117 RepID=UPI003F370023
MTDHVLYTFYPCLQVVGGHATGTRVALRRPLRRYCSMRAAEEQESRAEPQALAGWPAPANPGSLPLKSSHQGLTSRGPAQGGIMKNWRSVAFGLSLFVVPCAVQASDLGVNYNGLTRSYSSADVARTGARWVRAFVDVRRLQKMGEGAVQTDPDVNALLRMHDDGYKVILNLKYDYTDAPFPSDADSPEFKDLRAFTTRLLDRVFPDIDIIVVGNEPFIESNSSNRPELFDFYKHIANHVITYDRNSGRPIPLYVGAFNNVENPKARTPEVDALLHYARNTPGVAGVDLHLHVSSLEQMREAIDFTKNEIGPGKRIISTEFSLKNYFKAQLERPIDQRFAAAWRVDPSWKIWQYLNYALRTPGPRAEWLAFLQASAWFSAVDSSLADADRLFDREGLAVATYALRQTQPGIGPRTDPWILNALYCNQTCLPGPSGGPSPNYWMESFRARQRERQ